MRWAAKFNPFLVINRIASASVIGPTVLIKHSDDKEWLEIARAETLVALKVDYTQSDLILQAIAIDFKLGLQDEAQALYDQFKRVDPRSPVIQYVNRLHVQGAAPSPPHP